MNGKPFNALPVTDKYWLLNEFGTHLMSLVMYDYRVDLYSLNGDFIEAYQNIENRDIERVTIVNPYALDKYLTQITLNNLIKN